MYSDRRLEEGLIPEVTLNLANVVFSNLIFIGNAIAVPSKHQIDLILAYNSKRNIYIPHPHTVLLISVALSFILNFETLKFHELSRNY